MIKYDSRKYVKNEEIKISSPKKNSEKNTAWSKLHFDLLNLPARQVQIKWGQYANNPLCSSGVLRVYCSVASKAQCDSSPNWFLIDHAEPQ